MSISLASQAADKLTLQRAISPDAYSIKRMREEHSYEDCLKVFVKLLIAADIASGGDGDASRLEVVAANLMHGNAHRSLGFVVLAIRDGLNGGEKTYGKLTAQTVNAWCAAKEAEVLGIAEREHVLRSFKNDNVGADYMDREQWKAEGKDRLIDQLRAKLEAKK